ncbi:MAG: DegT/DnrJ/EryC1/StrS family aminotransferase [Marinilabiliaceae bacterium]|nr:DegT/DnrJ/EryC1/StrS family aminotransferase [Marinilabiliaceae bacterium]
MVDLRAQYLRLKNDIDDAMSKVLIHTAFINGPEVEQFQSLLGEYLKVKHIIPCANGTDALQLALMALGLQPGDEVITTNFTFIATVEVIALLGLKPVLIDVTPNTFNIDVNLLEKKITSKTKVILPVHLFGQASNMNQILDLANKYNVLVVEDAAQCMGGDFLFKNGIIKKLGTIGDIGCTSFFPSKNLGCFGDGGACITNNDELAIRIKEIANHGSNKKYYHSSIGVNSRLDSLQAAILNVKLKHLNDFNKRRNEVALFYNNHLSDIKEIKIPQRVDYSTHVYHQYTLRVRNDLRDRLKKFLAERDIPSMVYYPVPIHKQVAFKRIIDDDQFPVSEQLSREVLSLPIHTEMTEDQLFYIVTSVNKFFS